jgi:hypothetical protein
VGYRGRLEAVSQLWREWGEVRMNKRARLARRILREHRQGWPWHMTRLPGGVHLHWSCSHCKKWDRALISEGSPRAYR